MSKITSYKKKDGKTYYKFNAYLGDDPVTGRKRYTTRRGFTTHKEATIAYGRLMETVTVTSGSPTFAEVYDDWIEGYVTTVKESTTKVTRAIFKNHIIPVYGGDRIAKITHSDIQHQITLWESHFQRVAKVKSYLSAVFVHAIRRGLITDNPCDHIVIARRHTETSSANNFLDRDGLNQFLDKAKECMPMLWYTFFALLAHTGIRRGEALALEWGDVDTENKKLRITKNLSKTEVKAQISTTKTASGNRVISISDQLISVLSAWKEAQDPQSHLIFANTKNSYITFSQPQRQLNRLYDVNPDLKRITPHGFRHTHCVLLFEAGASIAQVQQRLGHRDVKTTLGIYNHVTRQKESETADIFASYLGS